MKKILYILIALQASAWAGGGGDNFGEWLTHHVSNSSTWHLPFATVDFNNFHWTIFGIDMGPSLHVTMIFIGTLLALILYPIAAKRKNYLPTSRFGHAIEAIIVFLREDIVYPFLGRQHARTWFPFVLTLFFYLLTLNMLGLIPYMATATSNINFTAAMALLTFLIFNIAGIMHNGLSYIKNLAPHGIPFPVLIILYPIEIIGLLTKSAALSIRMFANLSAGHFIIFALLGLITVFKSYLIAPFFVGGALFIWVLEILVAFLQAYVFTLLTTLFIGSAIHQEH
jgi:F-type H+-transporting ATPase subunit a